MQVRSVLFAVLVLLTMIRGSVTAAPRSQDSPGSTLVVVHSAMDSDGPVNRCIAITPDGSGQQILAQDTPLYGEFPPICDFRYLAEAAPDGSGWLVNHRIPHDLETYADDQYSLEVHREGREPLVLESFVDPRLDSVTHHCRWCASWLPDSQQVLFWDEDRGNDPYQDGRAIPLGRGRLRLFSLDPVIDTRVAVFTGGVHQPVRTLTPDGQAALAVSPDGTQVLFRNGEGEAMTLDTISLDRPRTIVTLVDYGPVGQCAGWSPDSSQVVFSRQQESGDSVEIVNADGSETLVLAQGMNPAWSPDGQQIAFNCPVDGQIGACLIAPDGSDLQVLPLDYDGQAMSPYWSPDGRKLAFNGQRPGPEDTHWKDVETYDFLIYDLDSRETHILASDVSPWVWQCGDDHSSIRWSPDGRWVLYDYHEPMGHAGATEAGERVYRLCTLDGCRELRELMGLDGRDFIFQVRWLPVR